ncbi:hypothetical protein LguiB_013180 [Lonicera macranthoides]
MLAEIRGLEELKKSLTFLEITRCKSLENLLHLPNTKVLQMYKDSSGPEQRIQQVPKDPKFLSMSPLGGVAAQGFGSPRNQSPSELSRIRKRAVPEKHLQNYLENRSEPNGLSGNYKGSYRKIEIAGNSVSSAQGRDHLPGPPRRYLTQPHRHTLPHAATQAYATSRRHKGARYNNTHVATKAIRYRTEPEMHGYEKPPILFKTLAMVELDGEGDEDDDEHDDDGENLVWKMHLQMIP